MSYLHDNSGGNHGKQNAHETHLKVEWFTWIIVKVILESH